MGLLGRLKLLGRRREPPASTDTKTVTCNRQEEEESIPSTAWTHHSNPSAENAVSSLLWDAAHSPEVLSIRTSVLRDSTLDAFPRTSSAASSTIVEPSTASSLTIASPVKRLRVPEMLCAEDFKPIRRIGGGGCGTVYLVEHISTGKEFAMKVIDKRFAREEQVLREQCVLRDIATRGIPGIMELNGSFHNTRYYFLLTEYYAQGDLDGLIHRWGRVPLPLTKFHAAELLCSMLFIHDMGYVHRDMKSENVLLSSTGRTAIADFGFAKSVTTSQESALGESARELLTSFRGTLPYMSPEQFSGDGYSFTTDVWSFAVIVFKMLMGRTPWPDHIDDIAVAIRCLLSSFDQWLGDDYMDEESQSFLKAIFVVDPSSRPTLKELMDHPWFGEIDWEAIASGTAPIPDVGNPPTEHVASRRTDGFGCFSAGALYSKDPLPEFFYASPALSNEECDSKDTTITPLNRSNDVYLNDTESGLDDTPEVDEPFCPPEVDEPFCPPALDEPFCPFALDEPFSPPEIDEPFCPPEVDEPFSPPVIDEPFSLPVVDELFSLPEADEPFCPPAVDEPFSPPEVDEPIFTPLLNETSPPVLLDMSCVTTTIKFIVEDNQEGETIPSISENITVMSQEKSSGPFTRLKSWFRSVVSGIARLCSRLTSL